MELTQLFDYDLWANRQWLAVLERSDFPEPDTSVFQHILSAQEIWLRRCRGHSPTEMPSPSVDEATLMQLNKDWKELLAALDANPLIEYRRTTGEPNAAHLHAIARHVINHGTYHRGELRGLKRAAADLDFPDTDLIGFVMQQGLRE